MTWSRAPRICYAANYPRPRPAAQRPQAATDAEGSISAPHAGSASAAPIFLPIAQLESRMAPYRRMRAVESVTPRAPGRTLPPTPAGKYKTS